MKNIPYLSFSDSITDAFSMHYYVERWLFFLFSSGSTIHFSAVCSYPDIANYPWVCTAFFPVITAFSIQFPPLTITRKLSSNLEFKADKTCLLRIQSPKGRVYLAVIKQMALLSLSKVNIIKNMTAHKFFYFLLFLKLIS